MKKLIFCLCSLFMMTMTFSSTAVADGSNTGCAHGSHVPKDLPDFLSTIRFEAGLTYANAAGGGTFASAGTGGAEVPFEIDQTRTTWNTGIGFYDQPILEPEQGGCFYLTANIGYGRSIDIDEENLEYEDTRGIIGAIGIHYSVPIRQLLKFY